jgi:MoaA/NifB/PqqE/SkfB family radical SAM enzyme
MQDLTKLYKLPWKKYDNPNGWLELTTFCQLKCPGCYRGLDKNKVKRTHTSLNELEKQVDYMKNKRNVQTISLSGGEPLLYSQLEELVSYIASKNLRIKIYTNGLGLTKEKVIRLRDLGVTEFVVHIDKNQNRANYTSEKSLNLLRAEFCNLFRKVRGVNLGFIMPLSKDNFEEIDEILKFYKNNADVINLIVFTCYNDMINIDRDNSKKIPLEDMFTKIKEYYNCNPSSYLSKLLDKTKPAWLFFYPLIQNGKTIGRITPEQYKFLQDRYRKRNKRYFITIKGNLVKSKSFFYFFNFFKALKLFLSREKVYNQVILIIDSPEKIKSGWNLCEGCPDPVLYNKKLVPSCLLERIKKGEDISI